MINSFIMATYLSSRKEPKDRQKPGIAHHKLDPNLLEHLPGQG
ncbi:hypothetical protein [Leptolyngbya sp. BC1307]|nr:hypothetical protein [Leptolyngbya sp. BC1307]